MYVYVVALFLAMCSRVDVELPEEPQYQYSEHPSSEPFEQQEQFEEGKYNMNATLHKDRFIERQPRTTALPQDWNVMVLA